MLRWLVVLATFPLLSAAESLHTGAFVRLNQKGVDYFAELAAEALPRLIENVTFPEIEASSMATIKPHFEVFTKPRIVVKFLTSNGIHANLQIDRGVIKALMHINALFFNVKEYLGITITDVSVDLVLHFDRNTTTNANVITAERCDVIEPKITLQLKNNSELTDFEDMIINGIKGALKSAVCETAVNALTFIDEQHVQADLNPTSASTSSEGGFPGDFAEDLCADETKPTTTPSPIGGITSPIQSSPPWSVDLTMTLPPQFTHEHVTFGVNGGVQLASLAAKGVPAPPDLDSTHLGKKMIGVMLTDFVPNTFFSHIYDFGMGQVDYQVHTENLPSSVQTLAKLLCKGCHLQVIGSLTKKPVMEIDDRLGARVSLAANVSILFHGKQSSYDMINATTDMHLTIKPMIRNSRLYGDVALTSMDFDIKKLGLAGALAGPLEKFMSFVVPRTMWPVIRKRIRFALHHRGIKLPIICGLSLADLSVSYVDRAAVIQSDVIFDLELFLRKFKSYINRKAGAQLY